MLARFGPGALKERLQIEFEASDGRVEAGVDGGGLLKEWMDAVAKAAFDPSGSQWAQTEHGTLFPKPGSDPRHFRFCGFLLAKGMYEGILVEPRLAGFVLRRLLGRENGVQDLQSLDPTIQASLWQLQSMTAEELDRMDLTFEVDLPGGRPAALVPGGASVPVTTANVRDYVRLVADFKLNQQPARQVRALLRGFRSIIPRWRLQMFSSHELQVLIGGRDDVVVDLADWQSHVSYGGGYSAISPTVQSFWRVLRGMAPADVAAVLRFATACSRPPLLGFNSLQPHFGIHRVPPSPGVPRLPTASTCFYLLKLPDYSARVNTEQELDALLRERLLYAAHSKSGFEMS